jgi:hypothetical protein
VSKQTYRGVIHWQHRKYGPQMEKFITEGSSIRRAINQTLTVFFKSQNFRKERKDAHASLEVKCWRVKRAIAPSRPASTPKTNARAATSAGATVARAAGSRG